ncbi:MAG: carboxypeptidase-like regulatory domain-containing protein [Bacteroidales bacterium]|jgi:hypothetical protein|nr:carboxypeptidase-like regulatory domain-containing protein [Bacteroidales bacterium]
MKFINWNILIVFIFVSVVSMAQNTQTVRGKVIGRQTGFPVADATVLIENIDKHALSDNTGVFVLGRVPLGRQNIIVTYKTSKNRTVNEMAGVSARSFSVEEAERYAGSLGGLSPMVANYAGVVVSEDTFSTQQISSPQYWSINNKLCSESMHNNNNNLLYI